MCNNVYTTLFVFVKHCTGKCIQLLKKCDVGQGTCMQTFSTTIYGTFYKYVDLAWHICLNSWLCILLC